MQKQIPGATLQQRVADDTGRIAILHLANIWFCVIHLYWVCVPGCVAAWAKWKYGRLK